MTLPSAPPSDFLSPARRRFVLGLCVLALGIMGTVAESLKVPQGVILGVIALLILPLHRGFSSLMASQQKERFTIPTACAEEPLRRRAGAG